MGSTYWGKLAIWVSHLKYDKITYTTLLRLYLTLLNRQCMYTLLPGIAGKLGIEIG